MFILLLGMVWSCLFLYTPVLCLMSNRRINFGWAKGQVGLCDHQNCRDPVLCGNDLCCGSHPLTPRLIFKLKKRLCPRKLLGLTEKWKALSACFLIPVIRDHPTLSCHSSRAGSLGTVWHISGVWVGIEVPTVDLTVFIVCEAITQKEYPRVFLLVLLPPPPFPLCVCRSYYSCLSFLIYLSCHFYFLLSSFKVSSLLDFSLFLFSWNGISHSSIWQR